MSLEAMVWAMHLAPRVLTPTGKESVAANYVLLVLAEHASPDGTDAFPSIKRVQRITGLSERGVRDALRALEDLEVIRTSAAPIVEAKIRRGDRRPNSYDLDMRAVRWDLSDEELDDVARSQPLLRPYVEQMRDARAQAMAEGRFMRYQPDALESQDDAELPRGAVPRGADSAPRTRPRGATTAPRDTHGGQTVPSRGAVSAPEPLQEPPSAHLGRKSHQRRTRTNDAEPVDNSEDRVIDLRDRRPTPPVQPVDPRAIGRGPGNPRAAELGLSAARAILATRRHRADPRPYLPTAFEGRLPFHGPPRPPETSPQAPATASAPQDARVRAGGRR